MNILVIGGTRLSGVHLVRKLISNGHSVTIANRGKMPDSFGDAIQRVVFERSSEDSIKSAFAGMVFDAVFDNVAYCSNDIKILLDNVRTKRYVFTSTCSVYPQLGMNTKEEAFDPMTHKLIWCGRDDFDYGEVKRQAECAAFQVYKDIPIAATRFPFIVGMDDYSKRLFFYVEHIVKGIAMNATELNQIVAYIKSDEAGAFNAWLTEQSICGVYNASSEGGILLSEIIRYVEEKTGKKAIISENGDPAPYNGGASFTLNLEKAKSCSFKFSLIGTWIYGLLDNFIDELK